MSAAERKKRPGLGRTGPVRSWSTLFESPAESPPGAAPAEEGAPPLDDVIARSVQLGYRVIDEYLRQGQRAARRLTEPSLGGEALTGEMRDLGVRMTELATEVTRAWFDAFGLAAGRAGMSAAAPRAAGAATAAPGSAVEPARIRLEIVARQPTEVSLDLQPEAAQRAVVVHALRAADGSKPRLREVEFRPAAGEAPACLRLVIPPAQPAGIYSGLLVDAASNRPVGTVSVEVGEPSADGDGG